MPMEELAVVGRRMSAPAPVNEAVSARSGAVNVMSPAPTLIPLPVPATLMLPWSDVRLKFRLVVSVTIVTVRFAPASATVKVRPVAATR